VWSAPSPFNKNMALQLQISEDSYDRGTHTITINDDTGVYNAGTNPGGYGAPNPERVDLALVISTVRRVSRVEDVQWSDPLTDTQFDNTFISNGVFEIRLCALEFEPGAFDATLMPEGRVFYSVQDDQVYKVVVVNEVQTAVSTTDVYQNALHKSAPLLELVTSRAEEKARDTFWCKEMGFCFKCMSREYTDLRKVIEAAECYFEEQQYRQADQVMDFSEKIIKFNIDESLSI
jgi:hypothetical protein